MIEVTANDIESIIKRLESQKEDADDPDTLADDLESNLLTFLYLVVIFGKLGAGGEIDILKVMRVIHRVVADIKPKSYHNGKTLIHFAVDSDTPVNDFHTRDVVRFPCAKTTKLLIEAGVDVQTMDNDGNTPLHLIGKLEWRIFAFFIFCLMHNFQWIFPKKQKMYSHGKELFYKFVSDFTNKLVKQLLSMTVHK